MENKLLIGMKERSTEGYTENGAPTFASTLNANLDFFALASAKRADPQGAVNLFIEALSEDVRLAVLNLFHLRDIRGGQGERNIFRKCLQLVPRRFLIKPEFIKLIAEYGRWDDSLDILVDISDRSIHEVIAHVISDQLKRDYESKSPSLCAKWFPLPNSVKNHKRKRVGEKLVNLLCGFSNQSMKDIRKIVTSIRKKYNLVETNMTIHEYDRIEYDHVPSKAFLKYKDAFERNDKIRFDHFLQEVRSGEKKINTSCVYPHEIISQISDELVGEVTPQKQQLMNDLWNNLPKIGSNSNILVVVDTSGSMFARVSSNSNTKAIDVSIGLGIYTAENNHGMFKNHIISFSEDPKLIHIPEYFPIYNKYTYVRENVQGYNTNIQKVFDLILETAIQHRVPESEMPESILIISDMEFDESQAPVWMNRDRKSRVTNFELIDAKFQEAGIRRPQLVFWNVMSRGKNVPVRRDENNVILVSGLSPNTLSYICNGVTPEEYMRSVLFSERYYPILNIIQ